MLSPKSIISDFKALKDKLGMDEVHAIISCWYGGDESVEITMYSKERDGNHYLWAINASCLVEIYDVELLTMKLKADLREQQLKKPAKEKAVS